jgi:hypothetical protein
MQQENRRSFFKKSLATSVSISFTGLIRAAHGETVTTTDTTVPETTAPETTNPDTTIDPTSEWSIETLPESTVPVTETTLEDSTIVDSTIVDSRPLECVSPATHDFSGHQIIPIDPPYVDATGQTYYGKKNCLNCCLGWKYV